MKSRNFAIFSVLAAALLLATIATLPVAPEDALAYEKNQATSQTSACGNEFFPINIGCQNTDSQIQGDENGAALTAQQKFPEVKLVQEEPNHPPKTLPPEPEPEPQTCEECFTSVLTAAEQSELLAKIDGYLDEVDFISIEDLCDISDGHGISNPGDIEIIEMLLGTGFAPVVGMNLDEDRIDQIVECLHRVLGF